MKFEMEVECRQFARWKFEEYQIPCKCVIDGKRAHATVKIEKYGESFPDCLKVKAALYEYLKDTPTTAEGLFGKVAEWLPQFNIEVRWITGSHGPIVIKGMAIEIPD